MKHLIKSYLPEFTQSILFPIKKVKYETINQKSSTYLIGKNNTYLDESKLLGSLCLVGDEGVGKTTFATNLVIQHVLKGKGVFFTDLFGKKDTINKVKHAIKLSNRHKDVIEIDIAVDRSTDNGKKEFLRRISELEKMDWRTIISKKKIVLVTGNLKDTEYSPKFIHYLQEIFEDLTYDLEQLFTVDHLKNKDLFLIHLDEAEIYIQSNNRLLSLINQAKSHNLCVICSFKVLTPYYTHIYNIPIYNEGIKDLFKSSNLIYFKTTDYYTLEFLSKNLNSKAFDIIRKLHIGEYLFHVHFFTTKVKRHIELINTNTYSKKEETFFYV